MESQEVSEMSISTNEVPGVTDSLNAPTPKGLLSSPIAKRALYIGLPLLALVYFLMPGSPLGGGSAEAIPTAMVKRGDVTITLTEAGELRAEHQATIQAPTDKQIIWLAPEGQWIDAGEPLVKFESTKYTIAKASANSALVVARSDLAGALSSLDGQRNAEEAALLEYKALPELAKKGFINQTEVDSARLTYLQVQSQTRQVESSVVSARANVSRAEQDLAQKQRKLDAGVVLAPRGGLVVYATFGGEGSGRKIMVGMTPFEGMNLMYLPDISSMRVDTEISEVDLSKVKVGSPVTLTLDAYPDAVFHGEVTLISTLARQKISKITQKPTGIKVFDVSITVIDKDERLKPGLTTTADILVSKHENALSVPIASVFLDDDDRTVLYVQKESGVAAVPIEVVASSERAAIVSGEIAENDRVLLAPPMML